MFQSLPVCPLVEEEEAVVEELLLVAEVALLQQEVSIASVQLQLDLKRCVTFYICLSVILVSCKYEQYVLQPC